MDFVQGNYHQMLSTTTTTETLVLGSEQTTTTYKNESHGDIPNYEELRVQDTRLASHEDLESVSQDCLSSGQNGSYKSRHKSLLHRIWKFLRHAATEVIARDKPVLLDLEAPQRYRPSTISGLCEATGFTQYEVKKLYCNFKNECPSGLITKEDFHVIFSKFFPAGANLSSYSHYMFSTLDPQSTGLITFEDFAIGLSILIKGDVEQRLRWAFALYDINKDGVVTKDEIREVTASVYDLLGCPSGEKEKPSPNEAIIARKAETIFKKFDLDDDGLVTLDDFLTICMRDSHISQSLASLSMVF